MKRARLTNKEKEYIIQAVEKSINKTASFENITIDFDEILPKFKPPEIKPTLRITAEVMVKMFALVALYQNEISWHCFSKREKVNNTKVYTIYDLTVFPQVNTAVSTNADEKEYTAWLTELLTNPESDFENMRVHGHSHVNMQVFSSHIDDAYQHELLSKLEDDDYYIFLVLNKKMEMCVLIYDYEDKVLYESEDVRLEIISEDRNILQEVVDSISSKCKTSFTTSRKTIPYYSDLALDQEDINPKPVFRYKNRRNRYGFK